MAPIDHAQVALFSVWQRHGVGLRIQKSVRFASKSNPEVRYVTVLSLLEALALQDALKRLVDLQPLQPGAVLDEAQLPEFVHEKTDPGPCRANHLSQQLLRDSGNHVLRLILFVVARQPQQRPRQPFLGRVEKLINQVLPDFGISRKQVLDKPIAESSFRV